ncbi:hypothetical protein EDD66_103262 [Mobilisporobacter senegalensis]|uniref:Stage IV sporulation protein n=1 Tax=Mobilisporobacter senegalensis TaxID=1329262 RepID=A0A3N1XRR4_9FIRM|nr:sporulation protein YqfD [Mobilisporobacter senegalensis]ROR29326.1 hypothetical protein EDD66_103262 [Mobilisporobacter senegalensis]
MLIKLLRWFSGYLLVEIKGYSPERFINLCSNNNILIWKLKKISTGYEFYISVKGFKKLRPIVKKTRTRPFIIKRFGFPFLMNRGKKRKFFLIGIFLCVIILYSLSLFIWDISIEGEYTNTKEVILEYLDSQGVYSGVLKRNVNCQTIEEKLRKQYVDIGWVSAEIRGTRLLLKITETNILDIKEKKEEPHHIIATKDGIITSIVTRKGTPKVKIGSIVKKGDIIVSGIIEIIRDNTEIINKEVVPSDADVRMKTVYNYNDSLPLDYIKKDYTLKTKKGYAISIFNRKIILYKPLKRYNKYDIIVNDNNIKLGENFYLPVIFHVTEYREYLEDNSIYSEEEAKKIVQDKLDLFISKLTDKGVVVIENNVKIAIKKDTCIASGKIIVEESAIKEQAIDDSEWRITETDELSGDDN